MAINNLASFPPHVREYYDRLVLMTAYPYLQHTRFAQSRVLPKKNGDTAVFFRFNKLDTVPIPLVDGVTPPGASLTGSTVKAQVQEYGNFVMVTDGVEALVEDRMLNQAMRLLAQNIAQTIDEITRDVLATALTQVPCVFGGNLQTPSNITSKDVNVMVRTLLNQDALMISEVIPGVNAFGTSPVRPSFWGICNTQLIDDLEQCDNFQNVAHYAAQGPVLDGEWGQTGNVRWLTTSVGMVSNAAVPVFALPIMGKEAYGVVNLGGDQNGEMYVEEFGSAGSADPLHQRATVGVKKWFAARVLNDSFMGNLLCTHS